MSLAIRTSFRVIQFFVFGSDLFTTRKKGQDKGIGLSFSLKF